MRRLLGWTTVPLLALAAGGPSSQAAFAGGATAPSTASGGAEYGTALASPPVVRSFSVAPRRVVSGRALPRISVRLDRPGARTVRARVVLWPVRGTGAKLVRLDMGRIRTGRRVTAVFPKRTALEPGRYVVRVHVSGAQLARSAGASGRATLVVDAPPKPEPVAPPARDAPIGQVVEGGVFPVQGPHTYPKEGGSFGADRDDHAHEGQDVSAAEGLPVVAPVAGTVSSVAYQAGGAGYYVVLAADDGRGMFFAHCQKGSFGVVAGDRVQPGSRLCNVGSTGASSGPHLHFEIWPGGWRTSKDSRPVDPLPQLLAWDPDF